MKVFILTCINEESTLVSANAYRTREEAQIAMKTAFYAEKIDFEERGRLDYADLKENKAAVGNDEYCYVWDITSDIL